MDAISKKRSYMIDNLYAIGSLLVIIGHSHSSNWNTFSGSILEKLIVFIYSFHMPLYFLIAGFLLMKSYAIEREGYLSWIRKKTAKMLVPYFFLSLGAIIPKYYLQNKTLSGIEKEILLTILMPRKGVWGHLWFIPVLFLIYVVFGFLKQYITENNRKVILTGTLIISLVVYYLPIETQWFGLSDTKNAVVYFVIGMLLNSFECRKIKTDFRCIWFVISVVIATITMNIGYQNPSTKLLTTLLMISACWQIAVLMNRNSYTEWISRHSFTIYLYSWPFQAVMMFICE